LKIMRRSSTGNPIRDARLGISALSNGGEGRKEEGKLLHWN